MKFKRILVTGGAGFIGSHVVDQLRETGAFVRVLDNLEPPTHQGTYQGPSGVEFQRGDIRSRDDVDRAVRSMDAVIHLAATGGFTPDIARYIEVNSLGTALLIEAARKHRVRKIVVASSVGIYGEGAYRCSTDGVIAPPMRRVEALEAAEWEPRCPKCQGILEWVLTPEDKLPLPEKAYSISKYDQERLVLGSGIPAVALRFFLTYGPRQSLTNPYTGVVSIFSSRILNDLSPVLFEDGKQTRDFVFVEDVARAILLALEKAEGQVFNVGTGKPTAISDLAKTLIRMYKKEMEPEVTGDFRPGEARHIVADVKALTDLGWKPQVTLEEGLQQYHEWIANQGEVKEYFSSAYSGLQKSGVVHTKGGKQDCVEEGLSIVVPAYNEGGNIRSILEHILSEVPNFVDRFEVIVVNDGSYDGTGPIIDAMARTDDRVRPVHHPFNIGFGGAQKSGYKYARYEWMVLVPADHQFDARDLKIFWEQRKGVDLIASRRVDRKDPWPRRVVSAMYNRTMRWLYGTDLGDINWVKMWKRSVFEKITIKSPGFGVDCEIVVKAKALGFKITEVEVPHYPRPWGNPTGLRVGTIWHTAKELLRIRGMLKRMRNESGAREPAGEASVATDGK